MARKIHISKLRGCRDHDHSKDASFWKVSALCSPISSPTKDFQFSRQVQPWETSKCPAHFRRSFAPLHCKQGQAAQTAEVQSFAVKSTMRDAICRNFVNFGEWRFSFSHSAPTNCGHAHICINAIAPRNTEVFSSHLLCKRSCYGPPKIS